jgi:Cupredoxin-like domain
MRIVLASCLFAATVAGPGMLLQAAAEEMPVFHIEMKDGVIEPLRLEVPAGTVFKLELKNSGNSPAEFESLPLRKEKVLAPQSSSSLVFRRIAPGEYEFFDDFHPDAPRAVLVAK